MTPLTNEQRQLVENNMRLATYLTWRYNADHHLERDDAFQLACMGLIKAARLYDPAKGAFSTIATMSIKHEFFHELRHRFSTHQVPATLTISLDATPPGAEGCTMADVIPGNTSIEDDAFTRIALRDALAATPPLAQKVVSLTLYGATQTQIAKRLGISQSYTIRLLKSVQRRVQAMG